MINNMAAIDKIYLDSYEQYKEFKEWCKQQPPFKDKYGKETKLEFYLFRYITEDSTFPRPVCSLPYYLDAYLIQHCPFDFVQKELMLNYGEHSQEYIDEAYKTVMERGGGKAESGIYYWLEESDFIIENGVIKLIEEESDYSRIKREGFPVSRDYEVGHHFKCTKHPKYFFNRPFRAKCWDISIDAPDGYMWYNTPSNTWDFSEDFVISDWCCSHAQLKTIRALKRMLLKWKLPIGSVVTVRGRYIFDDYEFVITK